MTDKQIIKKFSDNHCIVLENNQISLREDEITAYRIVLGKSTNELLEFVKDIYLQLKRKEQTLDKIKDIVENKCLGCANFCDDCNIRFCVIKQILQVIRESEIKHEP